MSPFVLSVLKYSIIALLYFFVYRAVRAVAADLRGSAGKSKPSPKGRRSQPARAATKTAKVKQPAVVIVRDAEGRKLGAHKLSAPLEVGRADECAIRVEDTYVSQQHARLFGRDGAWFVEDLGSTNGTYLNDERVTAPKPVRPGDLVKVGRTILELRR